MSCSELKLINIKTNASLVFFQKKNVSKQKENNIAYSIAFLLCLKKFSLSIYLSM